MASAGALQDSWIGALLFLMIYQHSLVKSNALSYGNYGLDEYRYRK